MNETDTPNTARTYTSQETFAKAAKVSQPTVSRELKRENCPIRPTPPWDGDDLTAFIEWRAADAPDGSVDDTLKRAQAIKAQTLVARYTLDMASTIGSAGRELIVELYKACDIAVMMAYRHTEHNLAQRIASGGQTSYDTGKRLAWDVVREYGDEFSRQLHKAFDFKGKNETEMRPIVATMRKCVEDMASLGTLNVETLDEITRAIDEGEQAASAKFDRPPAPTVTQRIAGRGGEVSWHSPGVREYDQRLALDIEAASRIRKGEPRDEVLAETREKAEALAVRLAEDRERAKHERAREIAERDRLITHYRAEAESIEAEIDDEAEVPE
ncbi:MAG: hypothetical protein AAGA29_04940 [Planctomycetota bacterium]